MSRRDDVVSLQHMLDHALEAIELAGGLTTDEIMADRKLELALTRLVEIIGEAAGRVSVNTTSRTGEIPWAAITGMRHRLIHGYDSVDVEILRRTIHHDLPPLVAALQRLIQETQSRRPPAP